MNKWSKKSKTMRRYDLTAEIYEMQYAEEQEVKYKVALESLKINRNSTVLDVGCGSGLLFKHVANQAQTVVGVDISSKLLRQAKKQAIRFHNVHLIQADADHLPFKNARFNIVFAFTVLQNLPKPLQTLNELKRNAICDTAIVVTALKKIFSLESFTLLLKNADLQVVSLKDADELNCYVAMTIRS